jgi:hypothetical protein
MYGKLFDIKYNPFHRPLLPAAFPFIVYKSQMLSLHRYSELLFFLAMNGNTAV